MTGEDRYLKASLSPISQTYHLPRGLLSLTEIQISRGSNFYLSSKKKILNFPSLPFEHVTIPSMPSPNKTFLLHITAKLHFQFSCIFSPIIVGFSLPVSQEGRTAGVQQRSSGWPGGRGSCL